MRIILFAGFALGCLYACAAPASAGSINGMQQSAVCDPTTNQGLNCLKPASDGSLAVTGSFSAAGVAQGSTTSGQTVTPIGCRTLTSAPTDTTAQTNMPSCDTSGALRVNVTAGGGTGGTSVSQGSTTSGQNVSPMGCRTLTSAPTDTTAQTNMPWCTTKGSQVVAQPTAADLNVTSAQGGTWTVQPGNTANTTAWKVDGSAVTQPVSGSVSLTGATNNINNIAGTVSLPTGAATSALQPTNAAQASTTSGQTGPLVQCSVTTAAPTYTTAQTDPLNCSTAGGLRVLDANSAALLTAAQASTPAGSAIIGKVGIDQTTPGTTNGVQVNAALPAGTNAIGTVQPGTTPACGSVLPISQITSTDLHTASGKTYICSMLLVVPDAEVVSLVEGTGTVCATGTAALVGATTAANGMSFAANGGVFSGGGGFIWLPMQTTSDHLCLLQSGSGRIAGVITFNDH